MIIFFTFFCGFTVFSLTGKIDIKTPTTNKFYNEQQVVIPIKVIHILPLGNVDMGYINEIVSGVKKFYGYKCVILHQADLTDDIMTPSKTRYDADAILEKYNSDEYRLIVTEKDIASENEERGIKEWGIFGLGFQPGTTCVVSTYRLKKSNGHLISRVQLIDRLIKISLHEIGHNLGLEHCTNDSQCMMSAANGSINEVDQERMWLCKKCQSQIEK